MQGAREFSNALIVALLSVGLIVGALSISLVEFVPSASAGPTNVLPASPIPLSATPRPIASSDATRATLTPLTNATLSTPASCSIPAGWAQITVQAGDTLDSIAAKYRVSSSDLSKANCLFSSTLVPGSKLFVPPVSPSTVAACLPGAAGWVKNYLVQPGDDLYSIATDHYTTLDLLRKVNCRSGDLIYAGEIVWVPNVATRTAPPPGSSAPPYPTDPLTETALPFTQTVLPFTITVTQTNTPTNTPTAPSTRPTATITAFPHETEHPEHP